MQVFNRPSQSEDSSRDRIKKAAIKLFADRTGCVSPGYEGNGGGVGGDFLKWWVGEKLNKIRKTKIWGVCPPNPTATKREAKLHRFLPPHQGTSCLPQTPCKMSVNKSARFWQVDLFCRCFSNDK